VEYRVFENTELQDGDVEDCSRTATVAEDCEELLPGQYAETVRPGDVKGEYEG